MTFMREKNSVLFTVKLNVEFENNKYCTCRTEQSVLVKQINIGA